MAKGLVVISADNGSKPIKDVSGDTPALVAAGLNLSVDNMDIYVDGERASLHTALKDGQTVAYQKKSVKSGQ